jgi:hypothetical protein
MIKHIHTELVTEFDIPMLTTNTCLFVISGEPTNLIQIIRNTEEAIVLDLSTVPKGNIQELISKYSSDKRPLLMLGNYRHTYEAMNAALKRKGSILIFKNYKNNL